MRAGIQGDLVVLRGGLQRFPLDVGDVAGFDPRLFVVEAPAPVVSVALDTPVGDGFDRLPRLGVPARPRATCIRSTAPTRVLNGGLVGLVVLGTSYRVRREKFDVRTLPDRDPLRGLVLDSDGLRTLPGTPSLRRGSASERALSPPAVLGEDVVFDARPPSFSRMRSGYEIRRLLTDRLVSRISDGF